MSEPIFLDAGPSRRGWHRGDRTISLSAGRVALVSAADFSCLSKWKWSYGRAGAHRKVPKGEPGYPHRTILMHRQIMGLSFGDPCQVDHVNGDRLDNRRQNLRLATQRENSANMKRRGCNRSGVKGVVWDRERRRWAAFIKVNYKSISLGRFKTKDEAARAYESAARRHFGVFARLG